MHSINKVLREGRMPSSRVYVRRFSMCNCLTIPLPDTYTAHGMTIDYFVRKTEPGEKVDAFKVPKRIDTFLWSPFNEAYNAARRIDGVRYTRAWKGPREVKDFGKKTLPRWSVAGFANELRRLEKRVREVWGDVLRVLVLYDNRNAVQRVREKMEAYDEVAVETLDWPLVRVVCDAPRCRSGPWHHYPLSVVRGVLEKIETLEEALS